MQSVTKEKEWKIYGEFLKRLRSYEKEVDAAHEVSARECGGLVEPPVLLLFFSSRAFGH